MADCLRGHDGTIGERLERDLAALQTPLPAPYDACEKVATERLGLAPRHVPRPDRRQCAVLEPRPVQVVDFPK
jgi:hypothetical protein